MEWVKAEDDFVLPFEENQFSYYVRIKADSVCETLEKAELVFGSCDVIEGSPVGYVELVTGNAKEKEARAAFKSGSLGEIESIIRVM